MRPLRAPAAVLLLAAVLTACGSGSPSTAARTSSVSTIRFASYDFQENQILVEIYAEAARRAGFPVSVQLGIGTREVVSPALQQGVVDVVVDYVGTAEKFVRPGGSTAGSTPAEALAVLTATMSGQGVQVLAAAKAEDQNGFAVTTAFAAAHGVRRLSDLRPLASGLTFGGPAECPQRPFCLQGLRATYGLDFGKVRSMPSRAATVEALVSGEIDVGLLETTDARLDVAPVLLLADDRALQPHENVVPMVRRAALERWGARLRTALDAVSARLTTADLVRLNRAVELERHTPAEAADQWWAGY